VRGVGVSILGEALAIEDGATGSLSGRSILHWVRPDGSHARPPADEGDSYALLGSSEIELAPLLDGSIAVRAAGTEWTRRYRHLADRSEPGPAWLTGRSQWTFRNTRGNRGYAFFPQSGWRGETSADCSQAVELRAPSGRLCGEVTLMNPGGPCRTGYADQGWDGTVIERNARETCAYRWWPRLLAKDG
jgi:hypothetical protein